jgi:acetolactate synthase-1/2/3 large subunit
MTSAIFRGSFAEDLANEFANSGITDAFLVTGGAIAPFTSAIASQGRIKLHYMLTEQSAGIAAEAYGYTGGNPALLIVTSGPGVTNALTPVAAAWTNSSPMVIISGQARSSDVLASKDSNLRQVGNQHVQTDLIVNSIVKFFHEPLAPVLGKDLVDIAISEAITGRQGPVWLSIPQDVQRAPSSILPLKHELINKNDEGTLAAFNHSLKIELSNSKKPAILLGAGVRSIAPQVIKFAEKFEIPLLTTWPAMDLIPGEHDLYCGRPGAIPSSWLPNFVNHEADFLLILGARLDVGQVAYNPNTFAPNARVIRIDVDESEFERVAHRENWLNFQLDLTALAFIFNDLTELKRQPDLAEWWSRIHNWKNDYLAAGEIPQDLSGQISTYNLLAKASEIFNRSTIVTGSSGTCIEMLLQSWNVKRGQRIINSCGIGSMGFALAAAYGVAIKLDLKEILCIESDGSLAMNLQDLTQIINSPTIFKIIVLDSSGYKSIGLSQKRLEQYSHGHNEDTELFLPDIKSVGEALGFNVRNIELEHEIEDGLNWLLKNQASSILIAKVSSIEEAIPRLISRPNSHGVMETPPMIELWPRI